MALEIARDTVIAPLPTTERGQGLHLGGTLKKSPRILYCSKELVVQRNIEDINDIRINPEHAVKAQVAKFSPNGEWIASGGTTFHHLHSHSLTNTRTIQPSQQMKAVKFSYGRINHSSSRTPSMSASNA